MLKFDMQAGDFLLSTNILFSGNNYTKVALLFKFMNMRMVNPSTHYTIQETYCVDPIKDFWEEKRSEAISRLKGKDVVLLGVFIFIFDLLLHKKLWYYSIKLILQSSIVQLLYF